MLLTVTNLNKTVKSCRWGATGRPEISRWGATGRPEISDRQPDPTPTLQAGMQARGPVSTKQFQPSGFATEQLLIRTNC